MKSLAERIAFAMKRAGITQADLVRATKAKSSSVSNWVNGRTQNLKGQNLAIAAQVLGVSEAWLGAGVGPIERTRQAWPFKSISETRIRGLEPEDLAKFEAAAVVAALHLGLDVRPASTEPQGLSDNPTGSPELVYQEIVSKDTVQQETQKDDTNMVETAGGSPRGRRSHISK